MTSSQQSDRPFREEPTEVLEAALGLAATHARQAARFAPPRPDDTLPAVADLFRDELQHREAAMTDSPTPQPAEEPLTHVGWWCWRGDNHGHLATQPCRSDNVPIHVPAEWADEMRAVIQRIEDGDEDETAPAALPSVVVSADRAALLREVAEEVASHPGPIPYRPQLDEDGGFWWDTRDRDAVVALLRRKANEAEFAATPCSPVVQCEDGGEPCDVHERLLGHYDDSHELCPPDCGAADGPRRVAAEEQPAETQDSLPAWLYQRFMSAGAGWENLDADDRSYWEHQARAVRRAVTRGGFKADAERPAATEQPDTQTREARVGRCSAVMLRVHHAPHGWEPQPGMDPVHCPGYPQPAP